MQKVKLWQLKYVRREEKGVPNGKPPARSRLASAKQEANEITFADVQNHSREEWEYRESWYMGDFVEARYSFWGSVLVIPLTRHLSFGIGSLVCHENVGVTIWVLVNIPFRAAQMTMGNFSRLVERSYGHEF